jgi:hypothetical protein
MGKGKGQDVPVYVMKAYRLSRGRDPRRHYMQVSGQPHALAALLRGKEPWVLIKQEAGWAPEAVWSFAGVGMRTRVRSARNLV